MKSMVDAEWLWTNSNTLYINRLLFLALLVLEIAKIVWCSELTIIIVNPLSLILQKHFSVFPALLMLIILFMTESMESKHADEGAPDKDGSAKNRPSQLDSLTPATEG